MQFGGKAVLGSSATDIFLQVLKIMLEYLHALAAIQHLAMRYQDVQYGFATFADEGALTFES